MHRAPGELVHDQHLSILHDVVHVALEQSMSAKQLMDYVQSLTLRRVVAIQCVARLELLRRRHLRIVIDRVHFLR